MDFLRNPFDIRFLPLMLSLAAAMVLGVWLMIAPHDGVALGLAVAVALSALGIYDLAQTRHAVLRNYPSPRSPNLLLKCGRRCSIFSNSEKDGMPFSRDDRAVVYQRAKLELDQRPFWHAA